MNIVIGDTVINKRYPRKQCKWMAAPAAMKRIKTVLYNWKLYVRPFLQDKIVYHENEQRSCGPR